MQMITYGQPISHPGWVIGEFGEPHGIPNSGKSQLPDTVKSRNQIINQIPNCVKSRNQILH